MEEKQITDVVKVRIVELEDKLMDIIETANNYPDIPIPIFKEKIDVILTEIVYLQAFLRD